MAFVDQSRAMAKMNAYKTAAEVTLAAAQAGFFDTQDALKEEFKRVAEEVFEDTASEINTSAPATTNGGTNKPKVDTSDPGAVSFNFGKFKPHTVKEVVQGYYEEDGKKVELEGTEGWIEWLENDKMPARNFMRKQVEAYKDKVKAGQ